jgi:hypothetical protein
MNCFRNGRISDGFEITPPRTAEQFIDLWIDSPPPVGSIITHCPGGWNALPLYRSILLGEITAVDIASPPGDYLGRILSVYPSPSERSVNLHLVSVSSQPVIVTVVQVSGRVVQRVRFDNIVRGENTVRFDLVKIPAGVYFVRCETAYGVPLGNAKKLIVVR